MVIFQMNGEIRCMWRYFFYPLFLPLTVNSILMEDYGSTVLCWEGDFLGSMASHSHVFYGMLNGGHCKEVCHISADDHAISESTYVGVGRCAQSWDQNPDGSTAGRVPFPPEGMMLGKMCLDNSAVFFVSLCVQLSYTGTIRYIWPFIPKQQHVFWCTTAKGSKFYFYNVLFALVSFRWLSRYPECLFSL